MFQFKGYYFGINAFDQAARLYKFIKRRKFNELTGVYFVALSDTDGNLLDIYNAALAVFEKHRIIGIALGREEAMNLSAELVEKVYGETGGFDIENYVKGQ